jgi:hypothetical protein
MPIYLYKKKRFLVFCDLFVVCNWKAAGVQVVKNQHKHVFTKPKTLNKLKVRNTRVVRAPFLVAVNFVASDSLTMLNKHALESGHSGFLLTFKCMEQHIDDIKLS